MHVRAFGWVRGVVGEFRGGRFIDDVVSVVEFGALDINGTVRAAFPSSVGWWGVDRQEGPGVDEVSDVVVWEPAEPVDCVVCCEVLEHAEDGQGVCDSAFRALKPGGLFVGTCAGPGRAPHSGIDAGPIRDWEFYRNVDQDLLEMWLKAAGFKGWRVDVTDDALDTRWEAWR